MKAKVGERYVLDYEGHQRPADVTGVELVKVKRQEKLPSGATRDVLVEEEWVQLSVLAPLPVVINMASADLPAGFGGEAPPPPAKPETAEKGEQANA